MIRERADSGNSNLSLHDGRYSDKVTGQALTVNEKGEDVVVPGYLPLVKSLVYRYMALTVWAELAAGPGGLWSCGRSASARVIAEQGALRDASESDVEASLDA